MRHTLGVAVFSGMLGVTLFGIFFTPVFYVVIRWLTGRRKPALPPDVHAGDAMPAEGVAEPRKDGAPVEVAIKPVAEA
jgi:hypothetical protein